MQKRGMENGFQMLLVWRIKLKIKVILKEFQNFEETPDFEASNYDFWFGVKFDPKRNSSQIRNTKIVFVLKYLKFDGLRIFLLFFFLVEGKDPWKGSWFPHPPGQPDQLESNITQLNTTTVTPMRIMGTLDPDCDNAKVSSILHIFFQGGYQQSASL